MTNSKTSSINILIALEKAALQQVIDTQLPVDLLSNFSPEGAKDLKINVRRKGKMDLEVLQNGFKYEIPLQLFVQKDTMLGNVDVLFEMYLGFESKFLFKENWELATRTQLTGYQWITKPEIDLGLFNIPLEKTVLEALMENKATVCEQVDAQLQAVGDIRPMLNGLLSSIPNPIVTPANAQIWWECKTIKTTLAPLSEKEDFVYTKIGLKGDTQFSYGHPLEKKLTVVKAPDIVGDLPKESHLQSNLSINFRAVEKTALALLQKQSFDFKGQTIQFQSVKISKANQRIKVSIDLEGSFDGTATVFGKPVFDSKKQLIKLEEVDLDLRGNNFLSKTLVVFLKNIVEEKMKPFLKFPLQDTIAWANKTIKHQSFQNGLFAKAKINEVDVPNIDIQSDALVLDLSLKGYLQLGLESSTPV